MSKAAYVSEASSNDEAVLHNEDASHIKVALLSKTASHIEATSHCVSYFYCEAV